MRTGRVASFASDHRSTRFEYFYIIWYYYTVRSDDVKVLKSRWNFVKTKTTTPGNNIYTLLITFIAFTSFISSKFQTLVFPYKLSYYAWVTCGQIRESARSKVCKNKNWLVSMLMYSLRLRTNVKLLSHPERNCPLI